MIFHNLHWWGLFLCIPVLAGLMIRAWMKRKTLLSHFVSRKMAARLIPSVAYTQRFWKQLCMLGAVFLVLVVLLGPQQGFVFENEVRKNWDVLILLDRSSSMSAPDILPSRFEYAKQEIQHLITFFKGDRMGLLSFSDSASVLCPLTFDDVAVRRSLDTLTLDRSPTSHSHLSSALYQALEHFPPRDHSKRILIVLTDGDYDGRSPLQTAQQAVRQGVSIYTIGMGSTVGEPLPVLDANKQIIGYQKDQDGSVLLSELHESILKQLALTTSGQYFRAQSGQLASETLYRLLSQHEKKTLAAQLKPKEGYQPFLFASFILLGIGMWLSERRGARPAKSP